MFRVLFVLVAVAMSMVEATSLCGCSCGREDRRVCWAIENCVCRPFHNHCILKYTSDENEKAGKGHLVPVSRDQCRKHIPHCPNTKVIADVSKPPACGCKGKAGPVEKMTFDSLCHLQREAA
ncbi:CG7587, partial [Drosophila busckii]